MDDAYVEETVNSESYYNEYCSNLLTEMLLTKAESFEVETLDAFAEMDLSAAMSVWMQS